MTDAKTKKSAEAKPDDESECEIVYSSGVTDYLARKLGSRNLAFANGLLTQLDNAGNNGKTYNWENTHFVTSVVTTIAPRDELEALLATQMAAVHLSLMNQQLLLMRADNILQSESAGKTMAKMARIFTDQLEALEKLRMRREKREVAEQAKVAPVQKPKTADRRRRSSPRLVTPTPSPADQIRERITAGLRH